MVRSCGVGHPGYVSGHVAPHLHLGRDHGEKKNSSGGRPSSLVPCRGDEGFSMLGNGMYQREMSLWAGVPVDCYLEARA